MKLFKKNTPQQIEIKGKPLTCPVCSNQSFYTRNAQLNTSAASLLGLDWANRTATCYVCSDCTYIYWFLGK